MTMTTASRAADFLNTLGVNAHIGWQLPGSSYVDQTVIKQSIAYLGVKNVRDAMPQNYDLQTYIDLAATGVKFDLLTSATSDFRADLALAGSLVKAAPGSVVTIEGPNEVDIWPVTVGGTSTASTLAVTPTLQNTLYQQVHADPTLAGVKVLALTTAFGGQPDLSAGADIGNWHVYYHDGEQPRDKLASAVQSAQAAAVGKPIYITETGYYTGLDATQWGSGGVSQPVEARMTLNVLMDSYQLGASKTFLYELLNNAPGADPQNDVEGSLGLFLGDGTPKLAATAVHNLTTILADNAANAGSFATHTLDYSLAGLPATGHSTLLEKAGGIFDLVVWNEPDIWNEVSKTAIAAPAIDVTVNLGSAFQTVKLFDPISGTGAVQTLQNVSSLHVGVTDHPLIIEISGPVTPSTGGTSGAGGMTRNGTAGADSLTGGALNDVLRGSGGNDRLQGMAGNDREDGGAGADRLYGDAGKDWLLGGTGADTLSGGTGADLFVYRARVDGGDQITDFNVSEGDRIDVSMLFAAGPHDQASLLAAGYARFTNGSAGVLLQVDADGGGNAWTTLATLKGQTTASLGAADILIA